MGASTITYIQVCGTGKRKYADYDLLAFLFLGRQ